MEEDYLLILSPESTPCPTVDAPSAVNASVPVQQPQQQQPVLRSPAPRFVRQDPEKRLAELMECHPLAWTSKDVGDFLEGFVGLGQYRKTFVHHAISGTMLPKITDQILKEELHINSVGHREALLRAIAGLLSSPSSHNASAVASPSTDSPGVHPPPPFLLEIPGAESLKTQKRRAHLTQELEKAMTKAAKQRVLADHAQRTAELAETEVQRLQKALKKCIDSETKGKKGDKRNSPPKKEEEEEKSPALFSNFMSRLESDLQTREAKQGEAATKKKESQEESLAASLDYLQKYLADKNDGQKPIIIDTADEGKLCESLDEIAAHLSKDGVQEHEIAGVKAASGAAKKAQKLCSALKRALFLQRLEADASNRTERLKQDRERERAQRAAAVKATEEKDLKDAVVAFSAIGWKEDMVVREYSGTFGTDQLLNALLARAKALQAAGKGGAVDWELFKEDGLMTLANSKAVPALSEISAAPETHVGGEGNDGTMETAGAPPAYGTTPALLDIVTLLSMCRSDELQQLETIGARKKLLGTYRALRAQQFLRASREKLEEKAAKLSAAILVLQQKSAPPLADAGEGFLQRLAEDAARRARNRYDD